MAQSNVVRPTRQGRHPAKVAVVTGGSSGIGRETALALLARGCIVYDLSRHDGGVPGLRHIDCDVADAARFQAALAEVIAQAGRIDLLINNAGFGISGAAEFTDNADAKRLLDVNLFGVVNGCKAAIPLMRAQGGGRILNLGSVAGPVPIPFQAWYSVSKAAVGAYTAALVNELHTFGISLCAVLPGDIRSGFTAAREKSPLGDDVYGGRIARGVAVMERDEAQGMDPARAGAYIAGLALRRRIKPEYTVGCKYKLLVLLARLLPCGLKSRIVGFLYAR